MPRYKRSGSWRGLCVKIPKYSKHDVSMNLFNSDGLILCLKRCLWDLFVGYAIPPPQEGSKAFV